MERLTQTEMVLKYLQYKGKITSWVAIKEFGITRLSAKIYDLKKMGYNIATTFKTRKNRYGVKVKFAEYVLER